MRVIRGFAKTSAMKSKDLGLDHISELMKEDEETERVAVGMG
mgnify:CR=1 FL=1